MLINFKSKHILRILVQFFFLILKIIIKRHNKTLKIQIKQHFFIHTNTKSTSPQFPIEFFPRQHKRIPRKFSSAHTQAVRLNSEECI